MTVLNLRPRLHELVAADENRTLKQIEALGVDTVAAATRPAVVGIEVPPDATPAQRLLAVATLDYILRLDPLVTEVRTRGLHDEELDELGTRVPFETTDPGSADPVYSVSVGKRSSGANLVVDGDGWLVSIGDVLGQRANGLLNPVGPLAAAAIAAGEVFKAIFALAYPDARYSRRFSGAEGTFSFFDYSYGGASPTLEPFNFDALLVGLGGVGAGVARALGELGANVSGQLRLIDRDRLSSDNLNRVLFARWRAAVERERKVDEAKLYLDRRLPEVAVSAHGQTFEQFKRHLAPRRRDRRYDVVITGLDNDHARHEVQRDLPRVLIDAATGRDANLTVERSVIGRCGCLGCTRQMGRVVDADGECDDLPDDRAPSVSFVSGLAGTLAAGELIKEATAPDSALRGAFDHIFVYGPNPDLVREPSFSPSCRINCSDAAVLRAYETKYAGSVLSTPSLAGEGGE